jgi:site-specific DNA recombinase
VFLRYNTFALRLGYQVLSYFGGTYESAENDERKEFQSMLSFGKKSKERISYIIVASLERFSRNDNSIWLSGQLRKLGVEIVSVSQPIDTSNPSGQMQQKLLFLSGEFDNQLRKQKCVAGIKEMLLRGDWPTSPPMGYDSVKVDGKRRLVINEKGKLIRQAFLWKADNLSNETIRLRLKERGFVLFRQRMSEIFRNPFYCGMVAHNMLEGKVIPGNHEELIAKDIFFKVNGILAKHTHGYQVKEENEAIPLKRFLLCGHCEKLLRGYIVKKKNLYYYKCCTQSCCNNKSAAVLHERFAAMLEALDLTISKDLIKLVKTQMVATFNQLTKGSDDCYRMLDAQRKEVVKKIERLEERYIGEEINGELYKKYLG